MPLLLSFVPISKSRIVFRCEEGRAGTLASLLSCGVGSASSCESSLRPVLSRDLAETSVRRHFLPGAQETHYQLVHAEDVKAQLATPSGYSLIPAHPEAPLPIALQPGFCPFCVGKQSHHSWNSCVAPSLGHSLVDHANRVLCLVSRTPSTVVSMSATRSSSLDASMRSSPFRNGSRCGSTLVQRRVALVEDL